MYDYTLNIYQFSGKRQWLMVSSQPNIHRDYREDLEAQLLEKHTQEKDLLILDKCVPFSNLTVRCRGSDMYQYPQVLSVSYMSIGF